MTAKQRDKLVSANRERNMQGTLDGMVVVGHPKILDSRRRAVDEKTPMPRKTIHKRALREHTTGLECRTSSYDSSQNTMS